MPPETSSPAIPRCSRFTQAFGKLGLRLSGFRLESVPVRDAKLACIAAPHTSNWDLPIFLAAAWALGLRVSWLGKHTLFRFPFGIGRPQKRIVAFAD